MSGSQQSSSSSSGSDVYKSVYSPTFLSRIYDVYVLGFNMRWIWRCSTSAILEPFFAENFSRNHLDVGVATGYFPAVALSRPWRTGSRQRLTLLDVNGNSLAAARSRVLAMAPGAEVECVEADVKADLPRELKGRRFDSVTMFNLFHCVPGSDKVRAISTYKDVLSDEGVLAGCTVLGDGAATSWVNRWYVRKFNRKGIFNNLEDGRQMFEEVLRREFDEVDVWVFGMTLVFRATRPKRHVESVAAVGKLS
jgi:ubiquinone/menaquinone biosynthesis C-methylase UbiE